MGHSYGEYNEDPVFSSLVSATTFSARRRTIYVFFDPGAGKSLERLALGGGSQGDLYTAYRDTMLGNAELSDKHQWQLLAHLIKTRDPKSIAVDISQTHAFADGLSAGEWEQLQDALGPEYVSRVVRAERLALDYIAIRVPEMMPMYRRLVGIARGIIGEAFSNKVIKPGTTTTQDVAWWMREKAQELGLEIWFQPSVDLHKERGYPVIHGMPSH